MKKGKFTDEKMVLILQEVDRSSVAAVARKYAVSEQTLYNWRKQFSGLAPSDVKRLRQLEQENARLKKIVAERDLELEIMKEVNAKKW